MAHASRNVRKLRRIKRERSLAFKMADIALKQRDQARAFVNALLKNIPEGGPSTTTELSTVPAETTNEEPIVNET